MVWETNTKEQQEVLYAEEYDLELKAVDIGIANYQDLRTKYYDKHQKSLMATGQKLIVEAMESVLPAVERTQQAVYNRERIAGINKWGLAFISLPADKLALVGLSTAVNTADTLTFAKACLAVGKNVKTERAYSILKKDYPDVTKSILKDVKNLSPGAVRRMVKRAKFVDKEWDLMTRGWVGHRLLEIIITHTRLFEIQMEYIEGRTFARFHFTPEARDALHKLDSNQEILRPFFLPMIVPPKKWVSPNDGGYLIHKELLIKSSPRHLLSYTNANMVHTYEAVNLIQNVPCRVNKWLLSHMKKAWQQGGCLGGLRPQDDLPLPDRPVDIDTNRDAKTEWKAQARVVYRKNAELDPQRVSMDRKIRIAEMLKDRKALWFPVQLDWRSRIYPRPIDLHYQSDDAGKSLLEFARGKPLGEDGFFWLSIHIANSFGYDKASFQDRYDWVNKNHTTELMQSVRDPFGCTAWAELAGETDNPWGALAALREWAEVREKGHPETYISHIPVGIDGSCNGLQHFSAIGRDPVGGAMVNLIPSDVPADIYSEVAQKVIERVTNEAKSGSEAAKAWVGHVTRQTVKRAVMTTPYGVTPRGIFQQFFKDGHLVGLEGNPNDNARYMRTVVYEIIGEVVVSARRYMIWLQQVAILASQKGLAIRWSHPEDFLVIQEYLESRRTCIRSVFQNVYLREHYKKASLNTIKQRNGLAPNYIHRLDAAHLMNTAVSAQKRFGIVDILAAHDCYSVHAGDIKNLRLVIPDEFILLHEQNPIDRFKEQVEEQSGLSLPPPPERGSLDLSVIRKSPYFFH